MLQQARQRADVFVRDVCPTTKIVKTLPRVSTHERSHCHEGYFCSNGCVSMSLNVVKFNTEEPEIDSYQHEQGQECKGDEFFAVKGKGKFVLNVD